MLIKRLWLKIICCGLLISLVVAGAVWGLSTEPQDDSATLTVTLIGSQEMTVEYGSDFKDPGAEALFCDGDSQETYHVPVTAEGTIDPNKLGIHWIKYTAIQKNHIGTSYRRVCVVDTQAPIITLIADPEKYTIPNETYIEEGFSAVDNCDGDLTALVERTETEGVVTYTVTDSSGNTATVQRKILYDDPVAPVLKLKGDKYMALKVGQTFQEPGYTASDNNDGDITSCVKVTGSVDTSKAGVYTLVYTVKDSHNNTRTVKRTVVVREETSTDVPGNVVPDGKVIYLTFDDGPSSHTPRLLEVLKKYDVKATFFVTKNKYSYLFKQIVEEGHSIGVHTATHEFKKIYASEEAYFKDLYTVHELITKLTGKTTYLMRFPGGSSNTVSRFNKGIMTRLARQVQEHGFQYFDWNVDSKDTGGAKTASEVFNNVIKGVKKRKVSIVLQHDIKGFSVDAVEQIIVWGLENGYTFLPLDVSSPVCHHSIRN